LVVDNVFDTKPGTDSTWTSLSVLCEPLVQPDRTRVLSRDDVSLRRQRL